jgi:hypothetical protein
MGADSVNFTVTDVGAPTPNLTSLQATETLSVTGANTGAARMIGTYLVVTPLPRTDGGTNTVRITQQKGNLLVDVNGIFDATQPAESSVDRIVLFGAKASDTLSIANDVTVPATIDGGHGGVNFLQAGDAPSVLHGWFGLNTMTGGAQTDNLIGRAGHVRFVKSGGNDLMFAGTTSRLATLHREGLPPRGTFYRFIGNRLVPVKRA